MNWTLALPEIVLAVCGMAILVAGVLTALTTVAAAGAGLPLVIRPVPAALVCVMLMVIAVASGALAMGILKRSQPADLLR